MIPVTAILMTYDIDALVASNTNLGALRAQVNANDAHCRCSGEV
jgi:hypothetical protein